MGSAREAKRTVCAAVAHNLRAEVEREGEGWGEDWQRHRDAKLDLIAELERRGHVRHRAIRPTADAPALPLEHPDLTDETEST